MKMRSNVITDLYAEGYENGFLEASQQYAADIAALRAENAQLREALGDVVFGLKNAETIGEIDIAQETAQDALKATKPDPVYTAAPEMLELLRNIAYPRRGSEHEKWGIEHAAHEAAQLLARIEAATIPA